MTGTLKAFGELGESDDVVHDHRRLVTVKVRELKRLVIDQDNDAFLRGQQSGKPRSTLISPTAFGDACLRCYRRLLPAGITLCDHWWRSAALRLRRRRDPRNRRR